MTHRLPRRGLSIAQRGTLDEVTADLLARVRDLELVVATEAKPRELTPEEAERDNRLRIMLDDIRRESQRSQQAAQESQELAPAPGLAPEDTGTATPRLTQRQRLVRADWALVWAQRHEGDRRRHDVVVALDWLREWADEAGVTRRAIQSVTWTVPFDAANRDWRLSEARRLIKQQQEDPDGRNSLPVPVAIRAIGLLALEPEPEPEPQATPDPEELLTLALKHVDRARDGDACTVDRACPLVDRLGIDHCDREHVRQALDLLRQWQDAAGAEWRDLVLNTTQAHLSPSDQLRSAEINICDAQQASDQGYRVALAIARLERWQEQQPDDDVISAEILSAEAAAEMPTLPPDPTPTQRAGRVIHHLGLAMMGQDPGPLHWVNLARWELQVWPGVAPQPERGTWGASSDELLIAAAHYAGKQVTP